MNARVPSTFKEKSKVVGSNECLSSTLSLIVLGVLRMGGRWLLYYFGYFKFDLMLNTT